MRLGNRDDAGHALRLEIVECVAQDGCANFFGGVQERFPDIRKVVKILTIAISQLYKKVST